MKRFVLVSVFALLTLASCKYDDTELRNDVGDLKDRVTELETLCTQMNTNISSLQSIVTALQANDCISSVKKVTEDGEVIGYTISFAKNEPITIYHGEDGEKGDAPALGVKAMDGVYYWTLDGKWLTDNGEADGNKIPVTGEKGENGAPGQPGAAAVAPRMRINETTNEWELSTDGGTSWKSTGVKATGDAMFSDVVYNSGDAYAVFTLADGTEFKLPVANGAVDKLKSLTYIPRYNDAMATVSYTEGDKKNSEVEFDFMVAPKELAKELMAGHLEVAAVYTLATRSSVNLIDMPVKSVLGDDKGIITVVASAENLDDAFFSGTSTVKAALTAVNGISSEYVELVPKTFKQATGVADANQLFNPTDGAAAATAVEIREIKTDAPETLLLPEGTAPVSILFPELQHNADLTIQVGGTGTGPSSLDIAIPAGNAGSDNYTAKLRIDAPNTSVKINGKTADVSQPLVIPELEAKTADNTLIVTENVTVGKLTVKGGSLEIYGRVNEIQLDAPGSIVKNYAVYDAEQLKKAGALASAGRCAKIVLKSDIDLAGSQTNRWTPIDAVEGKVFTEFDGNGYTIRNLWIDNATGNPNGKGYYYAGLFYTLKGTVKNVTIEGATVTGYRAGVLIGRLDGGTVENCHVKDATVYGEQKNGAVVGFVNGGGAPTDVVIRNCSAAECTFFPLPSGDANSYQTGGMVGYLQQFDRNVLIENNTVSGITINGAYGSDNFYDMEQSYSHAFVGNVVNLSKNINAYDTYTIEFRNNEVLNCNNVLKTCDRTTKYFGWYAGYNNSQGYPYCSKLIVDGITYDRWIENNRLAAQIAAGGEVVLRRNYDLTGWSGTIEVTKPTTITISAEDAAQGKVMVLSSSDENMWIVNKNELTLKGGITINMFKRVVENLGKLTVEGGKYTTASRTSGTAFYNNAPNAVLNLNDVNVNATMFAVAGSGEINIHGGTIESSSSNKYDGKNWAYCIRAQGGGKMTIKNAVVKGVQGCIAAIEGSRITVENVTVSAKNSEPGKQDAFYALYSASDALLEVISGEFYSDRKPCCLASDDDNPENPFGGFMLKGGKYSSQPMNDAVSPKEVWKPESGYKYLDTGDVTYPYEIVPE